MTAGYSGTPLPKKLGLKEGMRVHVAGAPTDYEALIGGWPADVVVLGSRGTGLDFVHVFVRQRKELATQLPKLRKRLQPAGRIWVSWPKRASKVPTDVTEDVVRAVAFPLGLVDIKVAAVDDTWSGLLLVIRRSERPTP